METKNKVATVRKEGVSDSGKPDTAINEAKGMDAVGGDSWESFVEENLKSLSKLNGAICQRNEDQYGKLYRKVHYLPDQSF